MNNEQVYNSIGLYAQKAFLPHEFSEIQSTKDSIQGYAFEEKPDDNDKDFKKQKMKALEC